MGEVHELSNYDIPSGALLDDTGNLNPAWAVWFTRTHSAARSIQDSGITADRPTSILWVGRPYFDTTIGKPIWLRSVKPNVWVTATGAVA